VSEPSFTDPVKRALHFAPVGERMESALRKLFDESTSVRDLSVALGTVPVSLDVKRALISARAALENDVDAVDRAIES
jgi:hypothetical protein